MTNTLITAAYGAGTIIVGLALVALMTCYMVGI